MRDFNATRPAAPEPEDRSTPAPTNPTSGPAGRKLDTNATPAPTKGRPLTPEREDWLRTVIRELWDRLVGVARSSLSPHLKWQAEDIVDQALLKAIEVFAGLRGGGIDLQRDPYPWLARTITRTAFDLNKSKGACVANGTDLGLDLARCAAPVSVDGGAEEVDSELVEALKEIWRGDVLTDCDREVLGPWAKGMSHAEVAQMLGSTTGAV